MALCKRQLSVRISVCSRYDQQLWLDPDYRGPKQGARGWLGTVFVISGCFPNQIPLGRSCAVHVGLAPKTPLCGVGPKAGLPQGRAHTTSTAMVDVGCAPQTLAFRQVCPSSLKLCLPPWGLVFCACLYPFGGEPPFPFRFLSAGLCTE